MPRFDGQPPLDLQTRPPLNKYEKRLNILITIRDKVKWLERMEISPFLIDMIKYCQFHMNHGYETNDYRTLKDKIMFLIKRGHFK